MSMTGLPKAEIPDRPQTPAAVVPSPRSSRLSPRRANRASRFAWWLDGAAFRRTSFSPGGGWPNKER